MNTASDPVLELRAVDAGYGPFHALFGVSLAIERGEAVALLGANGAGKTTVARVASGLIEPTAGEVLVGGTGLTGSAPYAFARAGVAHVVEGRSVFASLTVEENLRISLRRTQGRDGYAAALEDVYEQFPALARKRGQAAGTLSGGEQRMLSIARVLREAPAVLVADELSLGLAPLVVDAVYAQLARLRSEGTSLLIVEQQMGHALELCDRVLLLEHGTLIWEGAPAEAADRVATHLFEHDGPPGQASPGPADRAQERP